MFEDPSADLLTVEQAAQRLGTKVRFIRRLVSERRIRFYRVGKYVRFHPDDLAAYIRDGAGRPDPARCGHREGNTGLCPVIGASAASANCRSAVTRPVTKGRTVTTIPHP
jgi:excisionase family DNA binding protein